VGITFAEAVTMLTDLGVLPVITIGATVFLAGLAYRRFRR
jgi:hypothetical protein